MEISIIGAGNVGRSLALGWTRAGHRVRFGASGAADGSETVDVGVEGVPCPIPMTTNGKAAQDAKVVVLAVPWQAIGAVATDIGGALARKVVIDATNPLEAGVDGLRLATGFSTSGGEEVARLLPSARVVKTMNQVGFEVMSAASGYAVSPTMFVATDDDGAREVALGLVRDLGFDAVDGGPLRIARLLEPMAMLWIDQALERGAPTRSAFAFQRPSAAEPGSSTVVEYVRYALERHTEEELIAAYSGAFRYLNAAPECLGFEFAQCVEDPKSFVLRIVWTSVADHMEGFRGGPHFPGFLVTVRPFIEEIAEMRHYRSLTTSAMQS